MSAISSHVAFGSKKEKMYWFNLSRERFKDQPSKEDIWNSEKKIENSRANRIKGLWELIIGA